jgi:hypothetical protein
MTELCLDIGLLNKSLSHAWFSGHLGVKDFDRDLLIQHHMPSQIDFAHSTFAKFKLNDIV